MKANLNRGGPGGGGRPRYRAAIGHNPGLFREFTMSRPNKPVVAARPPVVKLRHAPQQVRIIGGAWKRTPLPVTAIDGLRPTPDRVRETVFNWLGQTLEGLRCLDLFSGTGALGFEAASRGAARVVLVERHPRAAKQLRAIKDKLGAEAVEIAEADAIRFMKSLAPASFDVVFLDPPFDSALLGDALKLAMPLVAPGGVMYVEAGAPLDVAIAPVAEVRAEAGTEVGTEAGTRAKTGTRAKAKSGLKAGSTAEAPADAAAKLSDLSDVSDTSASDAAGGLPAGWSVERHGKAGLVHYHLLRREIDE
jgi:16S rRNA (guanine966-N2)-methyltransferase